MTRPAETGESISRVDQDAKQLRRELMITAMRLSRRRIAYSATMSSQFGHDIDFSCPHCGARYIVSYTELPIADSGSDYCECCKRRMCQWNSALQPRYRLVERPERKHP